MRRWGAPSEIWLLLVNWFCFDENVILQPKTQGWPKRGVKVAITALLPLDTQNWTAH